MSTSLVDLAAPAHTALITCEMQRGIIGDLTRLRELSEECRTSGMLGAAIGLVNAARSHGVRVVHATQEVRADGAAKALNTPFFEYMDRRAGLVVQGTAAADLLPEIGPQPQDIDCRRVHGLTPFTSTSLDQILRNLGVRTLVPVGVSLNLALAGLCIVAADLGYRILLPIDAVAGMPHSYGLAMIEHTYPLLATITTTSAIREAWVASAGESIRRASAAASPPVVA